jgi:AbrB family looped-hinge helix DNA binding protein
MHTKLSTKGQVVLSGLRRRLGLRPGDPLEAEIEGGNIVLRPMNKRSRRAKIVTDPITGFPVLTAGSDSPKLTSKELEEILASFP